MRRLNRWLYGPWLVLVLWIGFSGLFGWHVPEWAFIVFGVLLIFLVGLLAASLILKPPRIVGVPFRGDVL